MFEKRDNNLKNKKIQSYKLGYKVQLQKNRVCNFLFVLPDFLCWLQITLVTKNCNSFVVTI